MLLIKGLSCNLLQIWNKMKLYFVNDNLTNKQNSLDKSNRFRAEIVSDECSQNTAAESHNLARLKNLEETKHVRVLCWVMTTPDSHESRAKHVKATWGKRCNILYFVSTEVNDTLPSIAYNATESRSILWGKTKLGFLVSYLWWKFLVTTFLGFLVVPHLATYIFFLFFAEWIMIGWYKGQYRHDFYNI